MPQKWERDDLRKTSDFTVIRYMVSLSEVLTCTTPLNFSGLRGKQGGKTDLDSNHGREFRLTQGRTTPLLPTKTVGIRGDFRKQSSEQPWPARQASDSPSWSVRIHLCILRLVQHGRVTQSSALKPTYSFCKYSQETRNQILKRLIQFMGQANLTHELGSRDKSNTHTHSYEQLESMIQR